ncbi:sulfatase family protein, partial [Haloferula sp.]|uniref:sulfatase family protein n=1 Tax=Haloferula sp. TaxID=2497595 RepID=UPI003C7104FA
KLMMRAFLLLPLLLSLPLAAEEDRPNILLLFADDLGRYASAYADESLPSPNDITSTPAFDRVAREGALFENAFVSVPSCTPSRTSLNTGRHFFRNGSHSQLHHPWRDEAPDPFDEITGMPVSLQDAGYHIGLTYKLHMDERIIGGKKNIYNKAGARLNSYSQNLSKAKDKDSTKAAILNEVRGNFRDFLAKRKAGQPFFYSFNPTNTHRKWIKGSGKALWGLDPDRLKGKLPPFMPDNEVTREDFADYLGEGMAFDAACEVILDELKKIGELENTLICISGDHGAPGFPMGKCNVHDFGSRVLLAMSWPQHIAPGREVKVPVSLIDLAPTFLAAAGVPSKDDPDGENLLPSLAKGATDEQLRGWALIGREAHVGSARRGQLPYPVRAIRSSDHLYIINFKPERSPMGDALAVTTDSAPDFETLTNNTRVAFADIDAGPTKAWLVEHRNDEDNVTYTDFAWGKRPAEELYDLRKDRHQIHNLANDPEYREVKARLRTQLVRELESRHDPRLDNDAFDRSPYLNRNGR